jgi:hypothetical protein
MCSYVLQDVPSVWERDENWTAPSQNYVVGDPRQWNQGAESSQVFSHLCVVEYCHVEGEAAPCEDRFFKVVLSASPLFHSNAQN